MNRLDLVVLGAVAIGALIGQRVGFLIRVMSWLGLAVGLMIGLRLMPRVAASLSSSTPGIRLLAVSSLLLGLALIGHTVGLVASHSLRARLELSTEASAFDRVAGGIVGGLGTLVLVWLLIPALRSTPGWPARVARDSSMIALIDRYAPTEPRAARILGRIVGEAPYPELRHDGRGDQNAVGQPPTSDAGPEVTTRAARSVVLVEGVACGLRISGTGFAIRPDTVITNAHVVAGEHRTEVITSDGQRRAARVTVFNGLHDVALLHVPGARFAPLPLGPTKVGAIGSVLGHPNGGDLRATPARVARRIDIARTDIYRNGTVRTSIVGLAAHLIVGDSGAPVIGADGQVQAMVFAIDPASVTTAFALATKELRPFIHLARNTSKAASTGTCLIT